MEEQTRLTTVGATGGFSPLPLDVEPPPVRGADTLSWPCARPLAHRRYPPVRARRREGRTEGWRPAFPRLPLDLRVFRVDALDPHVERVRLDLEDLRGQESPEQPLPRLFAQGLMGALPQG